MEEESKKIDSLIESLNHPEKKVIRQAVEALISLASRQPAMADRLHRLLTEAPEKRRWPIAYILAQISSPSPSCLTVLKETLDHDDPDIRWATVLLLARLGKMDRGVVSQLLDLLKTGTPRQRRMAIYCLRDMELKDP